MTTEDLKRVDELIEDSESDFEYQPPSGEGYDEERIITIMEGIYRSNLAIAMMLRDQVNKPVNDDYDLVSPRSTSGPRSAFDTLKYGSKP